MKMLITAFTLLSLSAFAQENLNDMKQSARDHINKKINTLQDSRSCIEGAQTEEAFKACKYDLHSEMRMQKQEKKEKMKGMKKEEVESID